jgi:hypothetical protein
MGVRGACPRMLPPPPGEREGTLAISPNAFREGFPMKMIEPELQTKTWINQSAQRGPDEAPERLPKGVGHAHNVDGIFMVQV